MSNIANSSNRIHKMLVFLTEKYIYFLVMWGRTENFCFIFATHTICRYSSYSVSANTFRRFLSDNFLGFGKNVSEKNTIHIENFLCFGNNDFFSDYFLGFGKYFWAETKNTICILWATISLVSAKMSRPTTPW